jgi:hypothetical protein
VSVEAISGRRRFHQAFGRRLGGGAGVSLTTFNPEPDLSKACPWRRTVFGNNAYSRGTDSWAHMRIALRYKGFRRGKINVR